MAISAVRRGDDRLPDSVTPDDRLPDSSVTPRQWHQPSISRKMPPMRGKTTRLGSDTWNKNPLTVDDCRKDIRRVL